MYVRVCLPSGGYRIFCMSCWLNGSEQYYYDDDVDYYVGTASETVVLTHAVAVGGASGNSTCGNGAVQSSQVHSPCRCVA